MMILIFLLACGRGGECELGSTYGEAPAIDPAAPAAGADQTPAEEVAAAFEGLDPTSDAWRAYAFASSPQGGVLECAFCACGCATTEGHLSAIDCFKDLHGLDCGWCQQIALRGEELFAEGLAEDEVRARLAREYPPPD